jgi:hypothetical protein
MTTPRVAYESQILAKGFMSYAQLITSDMRTAPSRHGTVIPFPLERRRHRAVQLMRLHLLRRQIAGLKAEQRVPPIGPAVVPTSEAQVLWQSPGMPSAPKAASNSEILQELEQAILEARQRGAPGKRIDLMRRLCELAR